MIDKFLIPISALAYIIFIFNIFKNSSFFKLFFILWGGGFYLSGIRMLSSADDNASTFFGLLCIIVSIVMPIFITRKSRKPSKKIIKDTKNLTQTESINDFNNSNKEELKDNNLHENVEQIKYDSQEDKIDNSNNNKQAESEPIDREKNIIRKQNLIIGPISTIILVLFFVIVPIIRFITFSAFGTLMNIPKQIKLMEEYSDLIGSREKMTEEERIKFIKKAKAAGLFQVAKSNAVLTNATLDNIKDWIQRNIDNPEEAITWRYNKEDYTTNEELKLLYDEINKLENIKIIDSKTYNVEFNCVNPKLDVIEITEKLTEKQNEIEEYERFSDKDIYDPKKIEN